MKKILTILIVLAFATCKSPEMVPPSMTITPEDSIIYISPINPVTFEIKIFSNEDLKGFKIETSPYLFQLDTSFSGFVHTMNYRKKITIPDTIVGLGEDSTIMVTFRASDSYNFDEQYRTLKVQSGYPKLKSDTETLYFVFDSSMFYSAIDLKKMKFGEISNNFDIIMIYDSNDGFVLASPDSYYAKLKLSNLTYNYQNADQRTTKFLNFSTNFDDVTSRFIFYLAINETYINENEGNGYGISSLQKNDIIGFETDEGKKGILIIDSLNTNAKMMKFRLKVQE